MKIEAVAKNFKMCLKLLGSDNIVNYIDLEYFRKELCEFDILASIVP
jgi:hypothetical protein